MRGLLLFIFLPFVKEQIKHSVADNQFTFYPERYIYDIQYETLILSDLHLGKTMHFRRNGIALPKDVRLDNLKRLDQILGKHQPKECLILGDLFHSKMNAEWEDFKALRYHYSKTNFLLVEGNHDSFNKKEYQKANIEVLSSLEREGILYTHEPMETELMNCFGHIHPAIRLKGNALQSLRLPCFYLNNKQLILPAFGAFTGMHTVKAMKKAKVFAIAENKIFEAKHKLKKGEIKK